MPEPRGLYEPAQRYEVAHGDGTLTYTTSDPLTPERTIALRVRWPEGATGPLPVVVVVHGGGWNDNGQTLLEDWGIALATAGYVAINYSVTTDEAVSHCVALAIPADECNGDAFMADVSEGGTLLANFYDAPHDASAILDRLDAIAAKAAISVDPQRVGALGHSAGAHAVLQLAGSVLDVSPSVHGMRSADPRFVAFVANSPQGIGDYGLTETSWSEITAPMLVQTGRRDIGANVPAAKRLDTFAHLAGPDAYQHYIDAEDTPHELFALSYYPGITGHELTLASTAIAFLDAYVRDRAEARAWLASDALAEATDGVSTLSRK